jgi:hypothetical protein
MSDPVPLIQHVGGKLIVCEEGAALLQSIQGSMLVVSVAGLYRTGKSFLLNSLVAGAKTSGFTVGNTIQSCTRGINIWVPDSEVFKPSDGSTLVLLDTEGMASMDQDESYDALIFSLGLLLSSTFVLNSMGVLDEAAIDRLFLVSELAKHVCVNSTDAQNDADDEDDLEPEARQLAEAELSDFFPPLTWVLRDFVVDLIDESGTTLTSDQYMETALNARKGKSKRVVERNQVRSSIRNLFRQRRCMTFERPAEDEESVCNAQTLAKDQINPGFVEQVGALRQRLLNAKPKTLFGEELDGKHLLHLARAIVTTMNTGGVVPSIKSAWEYVVDQSCAQALEGAFKEYQQGIGALVTGGERGDATKDAEDANGEVASTTKARHPLPTLVSLLQVHAQLETKAIERYALSVVSKGGGGGGGAGAAVREGQAQLLTLIEEELAKQRETLQRRSERQCAQVAAAVQAELEELLEKGEGEGAAGGAVAGGAVAVGFVGDLGAPFVKCMGEYDAAAEGPAREGVLIKMLTGKGTGAGDGATTNGADRNGVSGIVKHGCNGDGGRGWTARQMGRWRRNVEQVHVAAMSEMEAERIEERQGFTEHVSGLELSLADSTSKLAVEVQRGDQLTLRVEQQQQATDAAEKRAAAAAEEASRREVKLRDELQERLAEVTAREAAAVESWRCRHAEAVEAGTQRLEEAKKRMEGAQEEWSEKLQAEKSRHEANVENWKGELLKSAERGKDLHGKLKEAKTAGKKAFEEAVDRLKQLKERHEEAVGQLKERHEDVLEGWERRLVEEKERKERAVADWCERQDEKEKEWGARVSELRERLKDTSTEWEKRCAAAVCDGKEKMEEQKRRHARAVAEWEQKLDQEKARHEEVRIAAEAEKASADDELSRKMREVSVLAELLADDDTTILCKYAQFGCMNECVTLK